ncbi:DUF4381 domain-containing protein [Halovulum sp. GXIMD14793]
MTSELSPDIAAQLDQLRDIRLPEPIGWWPLASGWWLLIGAICVLILAALLWNMLRKRTARYLALRELEKLKANDTKTFATEISVLLRRLAMRKDRSIGLLKGHDWTAHLTAKGMELSLADYLADAPYAPTPENAPSSEVLRKAASQWIRRQ